MVWKESDPNLSFSQLRGGLEQEFFGQPILKAAAKFRSKLFQHWGLRSRLFLWPITIAKQIQQTCTYVCWPIWARQLTTWQVPLLIPWECGVKSLSPWCCAELLMKTGLFWKTNCKLWKFPLKDSHSITSKKNKIVFRPDTHQTYTLY